MLQKKAVRAIASAGYNDTDTDTDTDTDAHTEPFFKGV